MFRLSAIAAILAASCSFTAVADQFNIKASSSIAARFMQDITK